MVDGDINTRFRRTNKYSNRIPKRKTNDPSPELK